MTYIISIYDGFTPEVGDDCAGSVSSIRDPKTSETYFESLRHAKAIARQAAKIVNAAIAVVDVDTDTIVYVA